MSFRRTLNCKFLWLGTSTSILYLKKKFIKRMYHVTVYQCWILKLSNPSPPLLFMEGGGWQRDQRCYLSQGAIIADDIYRSVDAETIFRTDPIEKHRSIMRCKEVWQEKNINCNCVLYSKCAMKITNDKSKKISDLFIYVKVKK